MIPSGRNARIASTSDAFPIGAVSRMLHLHPSASAQVKMPVNFSTAWGSVVCVTTSTFFMAG